MILWPKSTNAFKKARLKKAKKPGIRNTGNMKRSPQRALIVLDTLLILLSKPKAGRKK